MCRHREMESEPEADDEEHGDQGVDSDQIGREGTLPRRNGTPAHSVAAGLARAVHIGSVPGKRRLGEMAVGGEPARCSFSNEIGRQFGVVGRPVLARLEGAQPVELVLLVNRIGDQAGDVAVVLDEMAEDAGPRLFVGGRCGMLVCGEILRFRDRRFARLERAGPRQSRSVDVPVICVSLSITFFRLRAAGSCSSIGSQAIKAAHRMIRHKTRGLTATRSHGARSVGDGALMAAHFRLERRLLRRGTWPVAGLDEVGRGPLAGPVCAAAVILDPARVPKGLDDSKQIPGERREDLYDIILAHAVGVGVAFSSVAEIDTLNIRQATLAAMRRALAALAIVPAYVLVDGNDLPPCLICAGETLIKGDARSASIAAASIVAKVTRDRLMRRLCKLHPAYGFSRHVGYGTREHLAALATHGPCVAHRRTFAPVRVLLPAERSVAA